MLNLKQYHIILNCSVILFLVSLFLYGNPPLYTTAYTAVYVFISLRAVSIHSQKRMKLLMVTAYSFILVLQLTLVNSISFDKNMFSLYNLFGRFFCAAAILFPFVIEQFVTVNKYLSFYFPSVSEISIVSFNELKTNRDSIISIIDDLKKAGSRLSPENLETIISDLPRHNPFKYINNGSLTEDYFNTAYETLNDLNLYIVISNTGSAASELISVFTKKQYNHASLSFDIDLKTIISYNGGERLYPPGLNHEVMDFFNKKEDASIIVYSLAVSYEQKKIIIDKVKEINQEGSAYNIMGLIIKYSHKSNIMFCSQFVYKMLKHAGLQYFEKSDGTVKPTDLVELDYHRKLRFAYEIFLNKKPCPEQE